MSIRIQESSPEYKAVSRYANEEIRVAEASEITGIPRVTLWRWAKRKPALIRFRVIKGQGGETMLLNKADVLYCATAHAKRAKNSTTVRGHLVFDKDGLPFKPKKPKNGNGRH